MKAQSVNFERGKNPKDALEIGLWKPFKDVFVTIEEFKENGGVLTIDRQICNSNNSIVGFWIGYDEEQQVDLMRGGGFKSSPVPRDYGVRIKAKVIYR